MYPFRPNPALQFSIGYPAGINPAQANRDMFNAIQYAHEDDFFRLLETALSQGASINALNHVQSDVLTVAVNANQPRKIQTLLAKGAQLPYVAIDGKDLLMIAAEKGNAEMVSVLLEVAGYYIDSVDSQGQTALHYAVKSGNKEAVDVLLKKNASINACSTSMDVTERDEYFDDHLGVQGNDITPLMIATAKSDNKIVELLLENDADPHVGACLPLTIAMSKDDHELIVLLLKQDADPFYTTDSNGKSLLKNAVTRNHSIECLRLIAAHIPDACTVGGRSSSLGIAIRIGNKHVVALLLASGYKPKDQSPDIETIWDLALNLENAQEILTILAASRSDEWEQVDLFLVKGLLSKLPSLSMSSADIASEGLFPEIFIPCLPQLNAAVTKQAGADIHTNAQLGLQTAHTLFHFGQLDTDSSDALMDTVKENDPPDIKWIAAIPGKKARQAKLLLRAAGELLGDMQEKLTQIVSLDFYIECIDTCPLHLNFSTFISNKLREETGIPDPIAKATGIAWYQSAAWSLEWDNNPMPLDKANRFVTHMAANMMEIKINEIDVNDDSLLAECQNYLLETLQEQARPLISFCTDPVQWLRNQEGRHNLKPVDVASLTSTMQIELGLPTALCSSIADGWSRAVRQGQQSNAWRTPGELQRLLVESFAQVLAGILQVGPGTRASADFPVPAMRRLQLLAWCEQAGVSIGLALTAPSNRPANNRSNNPNPLRRPAESEADGAPPQKKPRT